MKILYGTLYYEKSDITRMYKSAKDVLNNPSNKHDFLYSMDSDERLLIVQGMDSLINTLSWEFATESALKLQKIIELDKTLQLPATNLITFDEFKQIPVQQITQYALSKYENWLKQVGRDILLDEIKKK